MDTGPGDCGQTLAHLTVCPRKRGRVNCYCRGRHQAQGFKQDFEVNYFILSSSSEPCPAQPFSDSTCDGIKTGMR